ncbi:MAG TPA: aldo/keto reductase, partial [Thermoplasmata archaeon]|nr:aldo/keto reductase [Thermoplasmata archaeon]
APGRASASGTEEFTRRSRERGVAAGHFRLVSSGLQLSSIGLGTYLGATNGPTDLAVTEAARMAVASGRLNVLDTAINYRGQRAERSLGRAAQLLREAGVAREQLFIATKAGYLAPDSESGLAPASWVRQELLDRRVLRPSEIVDGSHAMAPAYLRDQVRRSRANLGLDTIDLLYLHNSAESQLPWVGRDEFTLRLGAAFGELEAMRKEGWIASYGLATWDSLRSSRSDAGHLELEAALAAAHAAGGGEHGLRYLQFPFNAAMPEAAAIRSQRVQGRPCTLFEAAGLLGLACFTSVPLLQGRLLEGASPEPELSSAQWAIQFARSAPGTVGPLVGMKRVEHLGENLTVAEREPWGPEEFRGRLQDVAGRAPPGR